MLALIALAGCMPIPASSAGMFDQAQRMAVTETAQMVQATQAAQATEAAQVRETQVAFQATAQAATAVMLRGTEIAAKATAVAIQDQAMHQHAEASVTAAWYYGQLTAIPTYVAATASRQVSEARRVDAVEDTAAWALLGLVWAALMMIVGTAGWQAIEPAIDNWAVLRDMARVGVQKNRVYDVSKQEAGDVGTAENH